MKLPADILAECLEAIERGEGTPSECLARYPDRREQVESLLRVASAVQSASMVTPRASFRCSARARLQRRMDERLPVTPWSVLRSILYPRRMQLSTRRLAMSWIVTIVTLLALLGGGGVTFASDGSLPGDALYPVKTVVEDVRLAVQDDSRVSFYGRTGGGIPAEEEIILRAAKAAGKSV